MVYDNNLLAISTFKTVSLVFFSFSLPFILLAARRFRQNLLEETIARRLLFATTFGMLFTAYENFAPLPSWTLSLLFELFFCVAIIWTVSALKWHANNKGKKPEPTILHAGVAALPVGVVAAGMLAKLSCKVCAILIVLKSLNINDKTPNSHCSKRLHAFLEAFGLSLLMFAVSDVVLWSQTYSWGIRSLASITFFYSVWNWHSHP